jgi:DmsE family decaheme c-type cytochrome
MRRSLCGVAVVALFCLVVGARSADASQAAQSQVATSPSKPSANPSGYAGADSCTICHADEVKSLDSNPHGKLALQHNGKGVTCESCHGPGQAHVDSGGDATKIFQFSKATPKQVEQKCLACHAGDHPNFERTAHGDAGVSCISCHSMHKFEAQTVLLKTKQPALCYQCHTDVKAAFAQPFHHRVPEGVLKCTDCHDPHGTFQDKMLKSSADQNAVCVKCHAETAGPFVYEHPPLDVPAVPFGVHELHRARHSLVP